MCIISGSALVRALYVVMVTLILYTPANSDVKVVDVDVVDYGNNTMRVSVLIKSNEIIHGVVIAYNGVNSSATLIRGNRSIGLWTTLLSYRRGCSNITIYMIATSRVYKEAIRDVCLPFKSITKTSRSVTTRVAGINIVATHKGTPSPYISYIGFTPTTSTSRVDITQSLIIVGIVVIAILIIITSAYIWSKD